MDIKSLLNSTSPERGHRSRPTPGKPHRPRKTSLSMQNQLYEPQSSYDLEYLPQHHYDDIACGSRLVYSSQLMNSQTDDWRQEPQQMLSPMHYINDHNSLPAPPYFPCREFDSVSNGDNDQEMTVQPMPEAQSTACEIAEEQQSPMKSEGHACTQPGCQKIFARRSDLSRHRKPHAQATNRLKLTPL